MYVSIKVWSYVGTDQLGPLGRGKKYVMKVISYFTKWPEIIPLHSKCAIESNKHIN